MKCPYCGRDAETIMCNDNIIRHYCKVCNVLEILEQDEYEEITLQEQENGWKFL